MSRTQLLQFLLSLQEPKHEYSHLKSKQQLEDEQRKPLNVADLLTFAYQIACGMVSIHTRAVQ